MHFVMENKINFSTGRHMLFLVAFLLLSLAAQAAVFQSGALYYQTNSDGTASVIANPNGSKYSGDITIKSVVSYGSGTYSVTNIAAQAFYSCKEMTSVTIPNSITSIAYDAFLYCSKLSEVTLNCNALVSKDWDMDKNVSSFFFSYVKTYIIGEDVTSIGKYALYGGSYTTIVFGSNITEIKQDAFSASLTTIHIKDLAKWCNITFDIFPSFSHKIEHLYLNGQEIKNLVIPSSVTSISRNAFFRFSCLTSVTIPSSVTSIESSAFERCTGLTSVTIPSSVTNISGSAFEGCTGLSSITLSNGVKKIGQYAFSGCSGLTSVTIPSSVTTIEYAAFGDCDNLTQVTLNCTSFLPGGNRSCEDIFGNQVQTYIIGEGVTRIGALTFSDCTNLTNVIIPNSVKSIGYGAFSHCTGLTSITLPSNLNTIEGRAFEYCTGLTSITLPDNLKTIEDYAFKNCYGITTVEIPSSVTSLGKEIFANCNNMTLVKLNSNAVVSEDRTSSTSMKSIFGEQVLNYIIGEDVKYIGEYAFAGCTNLTSMIIPSSIIHISSRAFSGCSNMRTVTLNSNTIVSESRSQDTSMKLFFGEQVYVYKIGNGVTNIGKNAFNGCSNMRSVHFPPNSCTIEENAFKDCTSLTSLFLENVTSIDKQAFYGCSGLTSLTIPSQTTNIENEAFLQCNNLTHITLNGNEFVSKNRTSSTSMVAIFGPQVQKYIISQGVTRIGDWAFGICTDMTNITLPNTLTDIGNNAFRGCRGLNSFVIPNSVTSIGNYAFYSCSSLPFIDIPQNVTTIGEGAFQDCQGLNAIKIGNSVTSIGKSAFKYCTGITSVNIPSSVENIGNSAFALCSGLTTLYIGFNVASIGEKAFESCTKLKEITSYALSPPDAYNSTFNYIETSKVMLLVSDDAYDSYKAHPVWKQFWIESPTGINEVNDNDNSSIYDLSGKRLQKMQRGINIVGGKKVLF